ncbi:hypothetical protein P5G65_25645 [Paenibacillus chondroitinus]|uniref:Intracellular proteinase inhibitor BsuPI domain-containing protein n=1 Tax=Paenibacillus chondroitinus TaxID=59842 RepID=A0ABU6DHR1_9BACL|nr:MULTISPECIES: hypothetical protein [Paenibacillus]MCY9662765.1 hypothetical protein [Paenibacillus anseongense]MEB4797292.1 hypothetical protein [Paenibacillus chondroitinus]
MRKQMLTLLSAILLSGMIFNKGVHAADSNSALLPLPIELVLNEQLTPVYDSLEGQQLYSASPQVVKVEGAESGWDRKLIQNNEAVWFKIQTSDGDRWVHLQNPEFREDFYQHILLTEKESFYNDQTPGSRIAGSVSPQLLRVLYGVDGNYLIQTWLGYRWMRPQHPIIDDVQTYGANSSGMSFELTTTSPMFDSPDAGSHVAGWLAPQWFTSNIVWNDWYYVDTWDGPHWINPKVGYPADLRSEETTLRLEETALVYEHPNKAARVLGSLAPQTINTFEHGGGWYHIHSSWLGDSWVYAVKQDQDPDAYVPPAKVEVKPITVINPSKMMTELGSGVRNYPFDLTVHVKNEAGNISSEAFQPYGKEVSIQFAIRNVSEEALTLQPTTSFKIDISRRNTIDGSLTLVWSGQIDSLEAKFASGEVHSLDFLWDQKDSAEKQVPFGEYSVEIKLPMSISYTKDGEKGTLQREDAKSAMLTSFPLRISAQ